MELRPYQQEAVNSVLTKWDEFDRLLGVAPTGSGKTIKFAHIANARLQTGRVLILGHRDELIDHARDKLFRACALLSSKEKAADYADLDAGVVVASVQTLSRKARRERFPRDHFRSLIVDEAHHVPADSYQRILGHFAGTKVLGVTATPDRSDLRSLGAYFYDVAFEISLVDLIKAGYLCRVKVQTVPIEIDLSGVSVRAGDFSGEELGARLEPVLEDVADAIIEHAPARKTLVFVPLVRIADQFAQILRNRTGMAAEMVSGACSDRAEKLARFSSGETQVLVNAMLLTEGYDEPSIDCIVPLRPTKIRSLYAQMVGRGTRIHPGKENLLLLDFLWISERHNLAQPVDLIAGDGIEGQAIKGVLEEAEGDLVSAQSLQRDRALARQIAANAKRSGEIRDLLDLVDVCIAYQAPELERWTPTMRWHREYLTEKQRAFLVRKRIDLGAVQNRGHASAIIDAVIRYEESIPATEKQKNYCAWLRHPNPWQLTKREPVAWIEAHK
jgi:superfamily II DNA or RNA helicase